MMQEKLDYRELIINDLSKKIIELMESENGWVNVEGTSYDTVVKACEKAGLEVDEEYPDTNGWQVDYWGRAWDKDGREYYISGSMYYGDHSIGRNED